MFEIYGGAKHFNQWDVDQKVTNDCMVAGDQVVFCNATGMTIPMYAYNDGGTVVVDVPNKMLMCGANMLLQLGQGVDAHFECRTIIDVIPREKPEDYVFVDNVPLPVPPCVGGSGGGAAEVKTCTVHLEAKEGVHFNGMLACLKHENGVTSLYNPDFLPNEDGPFNMTFENVLCDSLFYIEWSNDEYDLITDRGDGVEQVRMPEPKIFYINSTGTDYTLTLKNGSGGGWGDW